MPTEDPLYKQLADKRAELGWSQAEVAVRAGDGVKQQDVDRLERGLVRNSKHYPAISRALGISNEDTVAYVRRYSDEKNNRRKSEPEFFPGQSLPVFAAVEGGPGEMVVSSDPIDIVARPWFLERVREAYAVVVTGESMVPVYEPGDLVLVNPKLPPLKGKDAIFVGGEREGDFRASVKRYLGSTTDHWLAKQFNPPDGQKQDLRLLRSEWQRALRVVGKYSA